VSSADDAPHIHIELHPRHILLRQSGRLRNLADARHLQREVERAVAGTAVRRAVFDNRQTLPVDEPVGRSMWQWIHQRRLFERIAMLLQSIERGRRVNLRAAFAGSLVRAFSDEVAALDWLHADQWLDAMMLVFEFEGVAYAVDATAVAEVMAWQRPLGLSTLRPSVFGLVEHRGRMRVVCRPDGNPVSGPIPEHARIVVFGPKWGDIAVPAEKTHVAGSIQLSTLPIHGRELDTSIGPVRFIDPRSLAEQVTR
jgi:hypothetical protein